MRFNSFDGSWNKKALDEECVFLKGTILSKNDLSETGKPCILYGHLYTTYTFEIIRRVLYRTQRNDKNLFYGKQNDVIIPASGETPEDIATACCVLEDSVIYGGDLNVIRTKHNGSFLSYQLNGKRRFDVARLAVGKTIVHLHNEQLRRLNCYFPQTILEENKIVELLDKIDTRIDTQNKIIEKYESLIKQLNDDLFSREINCKIGDFIQECSKRNKDGAILNVLSVSNKNGFVKQSEQFEDKELASEDKTNYKIVQKGDFAFNPARINVGSIALLKKQETGIVSPMYICFKAKNIPNEVLESYFSSSSFKKEMNKRLEGSVRMCLTIDGMKNIRFHKPDEKEVNLLNHLTKLRDFVSINKKILVLYNSQKKYLLSNLFI